jgi:hypothetical protein
VKNVYGTNEKSLVIYGSSIEVLQSSMQVLASLGDDSPLLFYHNCALCRVGGYLGLKMSNSKLAIWCRSQSAVERQLRLRTI